MRPIRFMIPLPHVPTMRDNCNINEYKRYYFYEGGRQIDRMVDFIQQHCIFKRTPAFGKQYDSGYKSVTIITLMELGGYELQYDCHCRKTDREKGIYH